MKFQTLATLISNTPVSDNNTPVSTGGGGGSCFIATAAYGSPLEPHVKTLRDSRDRFLTTNTVGRFFLNLYDNFLPHFANFIAKYDNLRMIVRMALIPLVGISWIALRIGIIPTIAFILLIGIGSIGLMKTKRKFG